FPCGAIVAGVNDLPDASCFDVHLRLGVDQCAFPPGYLDAGTDAGMDAGTDAGVDAGIDAGAIDSGAPDSGATDAEVPDAGDTEPMRFQVCGCATEPGGAPVFAALALAGLRRRPRAHSPLS